MELLKCVLNKYQVPIDILDVIENNIKNNFVRHFKTSLNLH